MIQACSRTSRHSVRLCLADRWRGIVVLSGLSLVLMLGCGFTPTRALGIPGAASRTPDLSLPLQAAARPVILGMRTLKQPVAPWISRFPQQIHVRGGQLYLQRPLLPEDRITGPDREYLAQRLASPLPLM